MIKMVGYDMAEGGRGRSTSRPASAPRTSTSSSCTTASPPTSCSRYEALGLSAEGEAEKFIWDGDNTYGGKFVTNPSGGLLSKGHPLGATGLAQCTELVWQLRGTGRSSARSRARTIALQHNLGLGGAVRGDDVREGRIRSPSTPARPSRFPNARLRGLIAPARLSASGLVRTVGTQYHFNGT